MYAHQDLRLGRTFKTEDAYKGTTRRVLSFTENLMLVHYTVEEGATFLEYEYDDTHQAMLTIGGELELFGNRSATLEAGDSLVVGPGVHYGLRDVAECTTMVDVFAPSIEECGE